MSGNNHGNWFGVDKTQRLVPLTDEELFGESEAVEPPERLTLEKIPTATDIIRINIKAQAPLAIVAPPPPRTRRRWITAAVALAAIVALLCLI
jgi:hypothetical protein